MKGQLRAASVLALNLKRTSSQRTQILPAPVGAPPGLQKTMLPPSFDWGRLPGSGKEGEAQLGGEWTHCVLWCLLPLGLPLHRLPGGLGGGCRQGLSQTHPLALLFSWTCLQMAAVIQGDASGTSEGLGMTCRMSESTKRASCPNFSSYRAPERTQ